MVHIRTIELKLNSHVSIKLQYSPELTLQEGNNTYNSVFDTKNALYISIKAFELREEKASGKDKGT